MEYGLPSSHALNTVCLMGYIPAFVEKVALLCIHWVCLANADLEKCRYMLHYVLTYGPCDGFMIAMGLSLAFMLVSLIGIGEFFYFSAQLSLKLPKGTDDVAYMKFYSEGILGHAQLDRCYRWDLFWHRDPCILVGCP